VSELWNTSVSSITDANCHRCGKPTGAACLIVPPTCAWCLAALAPQSQVPIPSPTATPVGGERMSEDVLGEYARVFIGRAPTQTEDRLYQALLAERAYATSFEADVDALVEAAVAYRATVATVKPGLWTQQDALDAAIARVKGRG
jgi:hypothetical protein